MKRIGWRLRGLVLVLVFGGVAQAADIWKVLQLNDCTGVAAGTASAAATTIAPCCTGVKSGFCNKHMNFGDLFEVHATMVANGAGTAGGDALTMTEFNKLGLNTVVAWQCEAARLTAGAVLNGTAQVATVGWPVIRKTTATSTISPITIQTFTVTGTQGGIAAGSVVECLLYGY